MRQETWDGSYVRRETYVIYGPTTLNHSCLLNHVFTRAHTFPFSFFIFTSYLSYTSFFIFSFLQVAPTEGQRQRDGDRGREREKECYKELRGRWKETYQKSCWFPRPTERGRKEKPKETKRVSDRIFWFLCVKGRGLLFILKVLQWLGSLWVSLIQRLGFLLG
jgi:hypothetical protein